MSNNLLQETSSADIHLMLALIRANSGKLPFLQRRRLVAALRIRVDLFRIVEAVAISLGLSELWLRYGRSYVRPTTESHSLYRESREIHRCVYTDPEVFTPWTQLGYRLALACSKGGIGAETIDEALRKAFV